jgi:hypothetical protein
MSPLHRLFARIRGSVAWRHDHTASCKPIETGQRPLGGLDARLIETGSTGFAPSDLRKLQRMSGSVTIFREFRAISCIAATLAALLE